MRSGVIQVCSSCGQKNRVPWARLEGGGKCGKCGEALPYVAEPVEMGGPEEFAEIARILRQALSEAWDVVVG